MQEDAPKNAILAAHFFDKSLHVSQNCHQISQHISRQNCHHSSINQAKSIINHITCYVCSDGLAQFLDAL